MHFFKLGIDNLLLILTLSGNSYSFIIKVLNIIIKIYYT